MRRILLSLLFVLLLASPALAQVTYEAVTIDATAGGVALTSTTYGRAVYAECRLETAEIRYAKDGTTAPTALVGMIAEPFEWIILGSAYEIRNFRGFRTTATSGSLRCFYYQ